MNLDSDIKKLRAAGFIDRKDESRNRFEFDSLTPDEDIKALAGLLGVAYQNGRYTLRKRYKNIEQTFALLRRNFTARGIANEQRLVDLLNTHSRVVFKSPDYSDMVLEGPLRASREQDANTSAKKKANKFNRSDINLKYRGGYVRISVKATGFGVQNSADKYLEPFVVESQKIVKDEGTIFIPADDDSKYEGKNATFGILGSKDLTATCDFVCVCDVDKMQDAEGPTLVIKADHIQKKYSDIPKADKPQIRIRKDKDRNKSSEIQGYRGDFYRGKPSIKKLVRDFKIQGRDVYTTSGKVNTIGKKQ